ncbi:2Fe-2S iron-sulfur cluster binding domain-containing protein [Mariprofundus ferrinatatus]|uniref:2Fe-2S iron-sulfur cluster binding domain-containing protein n=1 Tax=Mariprofundus ferrinatatus TaxID=1921087 RepID=A0A2K8L9J6_9PROT|nr:(2Fe-2S)-binding protein [Mariprofundus ferrinatatus]ATX81614.1 2Fe-2S iron-sulfur cluster binding domain-containing protein [Mariprofundus ferrinatatus]
MSSPFRRLDESDARCIEIQVDGRSVRAREGESVAAALLAAGLRDFRTTPISGAPRAPYCMMGVCFECLVEINGVPNRQSCRIPVEKGMQIRRQHGTGQDYR